MFKPDGQTTTQRGYGVAHERARKAWEPLVEAGGVLCARCGRPIVAGKLRRSDGKGGVRLVSNWALDHSSDRSHYLGPSHARCNLVAAARAGAAKANGKRRRPGRRRPRVFAPLSTSRQW